MQIIAAAIKRFKKPIKKDFERMFFSPFRGLVFFARFFIVFIISYILKPRNPFKGILLNFSYIIFYISLYIIKQYKPRYFLFFAQKPRARLPPRFYQFSTIINKYLLLFYYYIVIFFCIVYIVYIVLLFYIIYMIKGEKH